MRVNRQGRRPDGTHQGDARPFGDPDGQVGQWASHGADRIVAGLWVDLAYAAVFLTLAWLRLRTNTSPAAS